MRGFPVRLDGPSQVALFAYDNNTMVVESFLPGATKVKVSVLTPAAKLRDLITGEVITALPPRVKQGEWEPPMEPRAVFEVSIAPHSYRAFKVEN